jgi:NitT/TauT family transport system substrate-binding protein
LKAVQDVPGSKILVTTMEQSHIIADIMFAKSDFIDENKEMIDKFYEGWMKAVSEMDPIVEGSPDQAAKEANRNEAAKYLGEFNGMGTNDGLDMMSVIKLTGHGDNKNFFGIDRSHTGQTGSDLYTKMAKKFYEIEDDVTEIAPSWRSAIYTGAVNAGETNLVGSQYGSEKSKVFKPAAGDKTAPAISNKPVSISFETGEFKLGDNAKTLIDLQFAETAKVFGNTKIRIEGNTDNVGKRDMNLRLSRQRAQSVADYLQKQYRMDPNRFVIIGNGPDKPVKGCEANKTESCKAQNRRTDFQLIAG